MPMNKISNILCNKKPICKKNVWIDLLQNFFVQLSHTVEDLDLAPFSEELRTTEPLAYSEQGPQARRDHANQE